MYIFHMWKSCFKPLSWIISFLRVVHAVQEQATLSLQRKAGFLAAELSPNHRKTAGRPPRLGPSLLQPPVAGELPTLPEAITAAPAPEMAVRRLLQMEVRPTEALPLPTPTPEAYAAPEDGLLCSLAGCFPAFAVRWDGAHGRQLRCRAGGASASQRLQPAEEASRPGQALSPQGPLRPAPHASADGPQRDA